MYKNILNLSARVDFQAALLAICLTLSTAFTISTYYHNTTYDLIAYSYKARSNSLYNSIKGILPSSSFTEFKTSADMKKKSYQESKEFLEKVREAFNVLYLYTAGVNENGDFVYIIDGLSEDDDFRYPGDHIEPEITPEMQRALAGEIVYPTEIKVTPWGNIFVTYFPFYEKDTYNVIGVIGIEFEAEDLYNEYIILRHLSLFIAIIACIVALALSGFIFRRMSNPRIKDTSVTDQKTFMKNRTAFSIALYNLEKREDYANVGMILINLDNLSTVNKIIGRHEGDTYIKSIAEVLENKICSNLTPYRLLGSEFALIAKNLSEEELEKFCVEVTEAVAEHDGLPIMETGISYGCAVYKKEKDIDIKETLRRADHKLQDQKRYKAAPKR